MKVFSVSVCHLKVVNKSNKFVNLVLETFLKRYVYIHF